MTKELKLVLTYKWYDMIDSGEKPEEYRDTTPFYRSMFGLPNGKLSIAFYDARARVREILPKKRKEE